MSSDPAGTIERTVDALAAMVLAGAAALFYVRLGFGVEIAAIAALASAGGSFALLRALHPEARRFALPDFDCPSLERASEVLLIEARPELRSEAAPEPAAEREAELLLDDVLAELSPDSRVVRLFDAAAMPTPGELQARIERHLGSLRGPAAPPPIGDHDASQALHEALAELRRSLR